MNKSGVISAIIVTYNPDISLLTVAVESILQQVDHVIIVDNDSSKLPSGLINKSDRLKIIQLSSNQGLAKAQNIGIQEAKNNGSEFITLFDQDSIVSSGFISTLHSEYDFLVSKGINVGAIGPIFYDRDSQFKYAPTVYKGPFIKKVPFNSEPVEVTFVIASGSFISISVLEVVGLMREEFFIDFVDVEWSLRAKKIGYSIYMSPKASMEHNIGDDRIKILGRLISLHSDFRKFYIFRNGLYMMKLSYVPFWYKARVILFNGIRSVIGFVLSSNPYRSLKVILRGWIKGVKGKPHHDNSFLK